MAQENSGFSYFFCLFLLRFCRSGCCFSGSLFAYRHTLARSFACSGCLFVGLVAVACLSATRCYELKAVIRTHDGPNKHIPGYSLMFTHDVWVLRTVFHRDSVLIGVL